MATIKGVPAGMHTVTPQLVCRNAAQALDFYKKAFGAVEMSRSPTPDGRLMHSQIRIGDSVLHVVDEFPEVGSKSPPALGGSPVTIHLYVENADAVVKAAADAGARVTMPPMDMFWGDRYAKLEDPFGHHWSVGTRLREVSPQELQAAAAAAFAKMKK